MAKKSVTAKHAVSNAEGTQDKPKNLTTSVKTLTKEINKLVNNNFQVTTNDDDIVGNITSTWDEINELKYTISEELLNLVHNVNAIITNDEIIKNISEKDKDKFTRLVNLFFTDVNDYSFKIKELRAQHEEKTGRIESIEEFEKYNRLAFNYYTISNEIISILSPIITEIIVISSANVQNKLNEVNEKKAEEIMAPVENVADNTVNLDSTVINNSAADEVIDGK